MSTPGRLVVCPTPIGNLEDVTLRVLAALRDADVVACEDTRRTRVLLERYGVSATLLSYHEHNERERTAELVERMLAGEVVALVSDAGMPLVSDPGYLLVRGCVAAGLEVEVLPGPSAALAALVASALPSDVWRFVGFLPRKRAALAEVFASPETVVAFESPRRVASSLAVLSEIDPERPVAVCRELTKVHEEVVRGTAAALAKRYAQADPRGEVVLVVGGAPPASTDDTAAVDAVRRLVDAGARARPAAQVVADLTGASVVTLYLNDKANLALMPTLKKSLKPGSRVVSQTWDMGDWKPDRTIVVDGIDEKENTRHQYTLYLWIIGKADGKQDNSSVKAGVADERLPAVQVRDQLRLPH